MIPVTILVTFIVLKLLGQSFNLMTLGGLAAAVGLVIDDAIVVVENIVLHRDAGQPRLAAIRSALQEISAPLVGSTITPIVVFLPLIEDAQRILVHRNSDSDHRLPTLSRLPKAAGLPAQPRAAA